LIDPLDPTGGEVIISLQYFYILDDAVTGSLFKTARSRWENGGLYSIWTSLAAKTLSSSQFVDERKRKT
jgi:hypothetical protein